jgi:superfamily I DNA/RNA helicase
VVKQLTVNFRSHNKILELANSIISVIEVFFPKTIDKLKKERSNLDGPKPIILANNNPELLFLVLAG